MINLFLLSVVFLAYEFHFYFWPILFICIALSRFYFNKKISLLLCAVAGTIVLQLLPYLYLHTFMFNLQIYFQLFIITWSIYYYFKERLWKKDVAFIFMEPGLFITLSLYFVPTYHLQKIFLTIGYWLSFYFIVQIILILIKIGVGIKLTLELETITSKWRLFSYCLTNIDASLGLRDLSYVSYSRFVEPSMDELVLNELRMSMNNIKTALTNEGRSIPKEKKLNSTIKPKNEKTNKMK